MNIKKLFFFVIVGFALIGLTNCSSSHRTTMSHHKTMPHHKSASHHKTADSARTSWTPQKTTVTLEPGKVYEVTFASIKKEKMADFKERYLPKTMPIVAEYGGKKIGMFKVVAKTGGEMQRPQMIALFEWPSLEVLDDMHNDPRMKPLGKIRDSSISFFRQSFYEIKKETTIVFRSDKTYEFFTAWLNPDSGETLGQYFKASEPMKKRHGPPIFKANLSPLAEVPNKNYILKPHMAGIVEWPNTQTYYELKDDYEFATKAAPLLEKAVARLDMIHAKFVFQR